MIRIALIIGMVASCTLGHATTIVIGAKESVTRIKDAIALAQPGDTLLIKPGIYREGNIILQKPLTIKGEGYPVLDGENQYEIFTIHTNHAVIQGLKFINTGISSINDLAAIKLLESQQIKILQNKFENTFFGIYLANSSHVWIEENELQAQAEFEHQIGNGIHLWKCNNITIDKNKVVGHRDGIYFEFVTNSLITNNHSEGNMRYGLHFMFSNNDEYRNNTFMNNGAGVAVMYTKEVTMVNNSFIHNWGSSAYGLLLKDIRDSKITGNSFLENSVGIFMEGSSRNHIQQNKFYQNGYALKLQASCDDNIISKNNFQQNTFDLVTNGSLVLNKIEANYWDRYEGYDLNKDKTGDIPYRPISMYGTIVERMPQAILLWRSFLVLLLDKAEKAMPILTPENLMDVSPAMLPYDFN
ncbi:MAG TPA: nitrous oxide reductase family maturation protein NosD [Cyclobacteriaceae bacterium]|jgi:nitrous oxidase accessory protein|nr:nitrous oxide reductase family maturation protein NosD [Cyclobacteriaceae bacterium]HRE66183.1 nitrous oxide reductase family maturation protein NosD [Cyclobacteriaceae bacterium]HRF32126.1 nitrous oxide reductase family maturation protein NosD [Cyclobacteriaceae bacterium]